LKTLDEVEVFCDNIGKEPRKININNRFVRFKRIVFLFFCGFFTTLGVLMLFLGGFFNVNPGVSESEKGKQSNLVSPLKGTWDSWNYYRMVTINSSQVDDDLKNFPILFNTTNTDFISKCNDGDSIRFVALDNTTEYYYEIEEWTATGIDIWVNVTSISSNSNTEFIVYYGNNGVNDNQDASNVWDSDFDIVWHCNETSGNLWDSTGNGNHGTPTNGLDQNERGMVDGCNELMGEASGEYVTTTHQLVDGDGTIEIWWQPDGWYNYNGLWDNSVDSNDWEAWIYSDGRFRARIEADLYNEYDLDNLGGTNTWYYICSVWDKL
jgi:hypothetical protein